MKKKRNIRIESQPTDQGLVDDAYVPKSDQILDQINRHLTAEVKYAFNEIVDKFPEKSSQIVAYANLSDEAFFGYVKILTTSHLSILT